MCSYNPPYYPTLLEKVGFKKEIDWYAYYKSGYDPIPHQDGKNHRTNEKAGWFDAPPCELERVGSRNRYH